MNKRYLLVFSLLGMLIAIDAVAKGTITASRNPSDQITILCRLHGVNGGIRRIPAPAQSDYNSLNRACEEAYPRSYYMSTLNVARTPDEQCAARGLKAVCAPGDRAFPDHHSESRHGSLHSALVCYYCIPRTPRLSVVYENEMNNQ